MSSLTITTDVPDVGEDRHVNIPGDRLVKYTKTRNADGTETLSVTYHPGTGIIHSTCGDGHLYDIIIYGYHTIGWRNSRAENYPWLFINRNGNREFATDAHVTVTGVHNADE